MKMKLLLFLILILITVLGLYSVAALSEEEPYQVIVDRATKECAVICSGDKHGCSVCYPPAGFERIGYTGDAECPAGYTNIKVEPVIEEHIGDEGCSDSEGGMESWVGVGYLLGVLALTSEGVVILIWLVGIAVDNINKVSGGKS